MFSNRADAGLEEISYGKFYIDGKLMNNTAPKDRDIAMVFQSYALYPQMTVYDNMAYALKLRKVPKEESIAALPRRPRSSNSPLISAASRAPSRAASVSASPLAGPSSAVPRSSTWTSLFLTSTPNSASR